MTGLPDDVRAMFPDLDPRLSKAPDLFRQTALDLEAGRITLDQARAKMRRFGFRVVETVYARAPSLRTPLATTLDPLAAWLALPPDVQQVIGASAIAAAVGSLGANIAEERADPITHRPHATAYSEALSLIFELVTINVLGGDDTTLPPRPDLRPLGIRQCRACGCTDDFACDGGCSWAEADLCSGCVPEPRDG